jgi:hypothetical protein
MTDGFPESPRLRVATNRVSAAYFSVLDIPLIAGRTFEAGDDPERTVVISRTLAEAMYGSTGVVGSGFPRSSPRDTVVGVVGDTSSVRPGATGMADLYRPLTADDYERVAMVARARGDVGALMTALREAGSIDPRVSFGTRLVRDDYERRLSGTKIASTVGASIGILTLLLACIGIFGVVSYGVTLRTREVGIHMALGAGRRAILRAVTRNVMSPVSRGMAVGTVVAVPIGFALAQGPLPLALSDPVSYLMALAILVAAGLVAALTPAMRALRTDPIHALRHE